MKRSTIVLGCMTAASIAYAFSSGPPASRTGAPVQGAAAEATCTACHRAPSTGYPPAYAGGAVTIGGVPAGYCPGASYGLTVSVSNADASRLRWGFQLTAIQAEDTNPAGTLTATDTVRTKVVVAGGAAPLLGRQYVEHAKNTVNGTLVDGTYPGQAGGAQWGFRWTAPAAGTGEVGFYAAGNAADDNGSSANDWIYTTAATSAEDGSGPTITTRPPVEVWPPNNKFVTISIDDLLASASDNCGGVGAADVRIVAATSDESTSDTIISADGKSVKVRAARKGGGDGRDYTITLQATDASGNIGTAEAHVLVPHDQGHH